MKNFNVNIELNSFTVLSIVEELKANLSDLPAEIIKFLFHFVNSPAEFVSFKQRSTEWTIEITLEPKQLLTDLLIAVRTRDFDSFLVKYSHDLPPLVDENNDSTKSENIKI